MKQGWLNKMQSTCFRRQITRWGQKTPDTYQEFPCRLDRTVALVGNESRQCGRSGTAWLVARHSRSRPDTQTATPNLMTNPKCRSMMLLHTEYSPHCL